MVQIDQESLDDLVDGNLRDFFRLYFTKKICKDPVNGLEAVSEYNRVHHFNLSSIDIAGGTFSLVVCWIRRRWNVLLC